MVDDMMVELKAADLVWAVAEVLEDTSLFAEEAQFVADEVLRLRDAGQLSKSLASDLSMLIYQRRMHSSHSGDFRVTTPIQRLHGELDHDERERLPNTQVDPVHVHSRIADITAGIHPPASQGEVDHELANLLTFIARAVEGSVSPGWDSLRYQVEAVGNVTSDLIYVARGDSEERAYAPDEMPERLLQLREAMYRADLGSWISLTMTLTSSGLMDVDYNYDEKPDFGFDVSAHDYALELQRFPRADESVPSWWRERIAKGD